ncbi:hypothetical protein IF2G_00366 [Cordyceps javanica]|nr:hypothetical protein IF2G_00366 [Cordyceps javanica]
MEPTKSPQLRISQARGAGLFLQQRSTIKPARRRASTNLSVAPLSGSEPTAQAPTDSKRRPLGAGLSLQVHVGECRSRNYPTQSAPNEPLESVPYKYFTFLDPLNKEFYPNLRRPRRVSLRVCSRRVSPFFPYSNPPPFTLPFSSSSTSLRHQSPCLVTELARLIALVPPSQFNQGQLHATAGRPPVCRLPPTSLTTTANGNAHRLQKLYTIGPNSC